MDYKNYMEMDIIMDKHTILKHFLLAVTSQRYIFIFYLSESKTKIFLLRFQKERKKKNLTIQYEISLHSYKFTYKPNFKFNDCTRF